MVLLISRIAPVILLTMCGATFSRRDTIASTSASVRVEEISAFPGRLLKAERVLTHIAKHVQGVNLHTSETLLGK